MQMDKLERDLYLERDTESESSIDKLSNDLPYSISGF